uniref:Uncharacterized protein n=1 Tax=Heliothis virescens TaxID=7102 RepID=A0A2A4JVY5_HELVI
MNFDFNLILCCITFLSQLHSVYLAALKTQSVSSRTPTNSPVDSKQAVVYRKMKPVCGPVQFPEYSCEELVALRSFADTSVLELADDLPKVQDSTVEPMYGLPEYVPQSSPSTSDGSSHTLQDVTDVPQANEETTVLVTDPRSISLYRSFETFVTESLPYLFDKISNDAQNVQNTELYTQAPGSVTTQNMLRETKKSSYYSSTSKPVFARSGLRDNTIITRAPLQKVIVTKSTYPFYPGGTTPEKVPEPSRVEICRLAKCVQMDWKDPSETGRPYAKIVSRAAPLELAVMKLRETSPKPTEKAVTGVESPPLLYAEDTYYFNEDI